MRQPLQNVAWKFSILLSMLTAPAVYKLIDNYLYNGRGLSGATYLTSLITASILIGIATGFKEIFLDLLTILVNMSNNLEVLARSKNERKEDLNIEQK